MEDKKVLLVDDEKSLRQLVGNTLTKSGYEVEIASSGTQALEKAASFNPDVILTDIMMPQMDGYELVKNLRSTGNESYIIFLTAKGASSDLLKGFDVEADDYLVKPFQMPELLARLKAGMRLRTAQKHLAEANEKLQSALSQRDDMIGLIAHDLRNPIHVINSYTHLLGSDTMPVETVRDVCVRRSDEMLRLINNVAEMGNMEKHKLRLRIAKFNLGMLLRERLYVFDPMAQQRDIEIEREITEVLPIFADTKRMGEIIDSLILAALQMVDDGATIKLSLGVEDDMAVLRMIVTTTLTEQRLERMLQLVEGGKGWNDGLDTSAHLGLMVSNRLVSLMCGEFIFRKDSGLPGVILGFSLPASDNDTIEAARLRIDRRMQES